MEKDICNCLSVSLKLPCVYVLLSSGDLFIFLVRISFFLSYFYVCIYALLETQVLREEFYL
jgi:hypothetical protein